ncbi:hypothetical protein [Halosimplex halophilum]|uniref:hypothetical protein n=1 Tax=Halosimplex halophilum TaxID=2559572 RepID=UPI00107F1DE5|nr:hypothetical protein [Halosimplex halophilum]
MKQVGLVLLPVLVVSTIIITNPGIHFWSSEGGNNKFGNTPTPNSTEIQRSDITTTTFQETPLTTTQIVSPVPTSKPTLSPTPTSVPTPTQSPTEVPPTASTSSTSTETYANKKYHDFVSVVAGETGVDAETPIRIQGWTVGEENSLVMILNLTARSKNDSKRVKQINTLVTSGYSQAVAHYDTGKIDGKITSGLQIIEVNNTGSAPKSIYVNNSLVREYYTGQIDAVEFTEQYWETERNMTSNEIEFAYSLSRRTGNLTLHNETAN